MLKLEQYFKNGQLSSPLNPAPTSQQRLERGGSRAEECVELEDAARIGAGLWGNGSAGGRGGRVLLGALATEGFWFWRKQCLRFMPGKQPPTQPRMLPPAWGVSTITPGLTLGGISLA
ncbi:unnamed protein product [Arctogadus glacialis]